MSIEVGRRPRKSLIVWLAQAVCALVAASCIYVSRRIEDATSAAIIAAFGLFYLALLIAIEMRQPWARWLVVFFFGLTGTSAVFQGLGALARNSEDTALLVSSAATFLVCAIVTIQFALGEPVKAFFESLPPRVKDQGSSHDDASTAPND
jgi:hydrogenase-4 membrane subunit HyfE